MLAFLWLSLYWSCSGSQVPLTQPPDVQENRPKDPFDASFDDLVARVMDHFKVPGLSIAILDGKNTYSTGYGQSHVGSKNATAETLYYTGSTTKSFTAAAVLQLVEDSVNTADEITLKTPISHLVEFVLPDAYATNHITLEDALSHRTGMPRHDKSYGGPNWTIKNIVNNLRNLPTTAEPRDTWQYCNMMFAVLSHVIETLRGKWLGHVFYERIWQPLGMTSTFLSIDDARTAANGELDIARGYFWNNETGQYVAEEYPAKDMLSGAGGIISSVLDYAKYLRGMIDEHPFISEKSHQELKKPRIFLGEPPGPPDPFVGWSASYGLGWMMGIFKDHEIFTHDGSVPGFGALMLYIPDLKWGATAFANTEMTSNWAASILVMELVNRVLEIPQRERADLFSFFDGQLQLKQSQLEQARRKLYPVAPSPADVIPPSLPLQDYEGTYFNPGYRNITLTLRNSKTVEEAFRTIIKADQILHANIYDKFWQHELEIEHVNGEHFITYMHSRTKSQRIFDDAFIAEFRIGAAGDVAEMGLRYDKMMKKDEKIWFKRV